MMTCVTFSLRMNLVVEQLNAGGKFDPAQPGLEWVLRGEKNGDCRRAGWLGIEGVAGVCGAGTVIFYYLALHFTSLVINGLRFLVAFHCGLHGVLAGNLNGVPCPARGGCTWGEGVGLAGWPMPYNTFGRGKIIHVARWWAELRCCRFHAPKKERGGLPMGGRSRKKEGRSAAWKLSA